MNEELLKIADGLLVIADSIREMVKKGAESPAPEETGKKDNRQEDMAKPEQKQQVSIEDVRAVLAAKSQDGKTREVKALLMKYDAEAAKDSSIQSVETIINKNLLNIEKDELREKVKVSLVSPSFDSIASFLESYDFKGKTVVPFATSGGSGMGKTSGILQKVCPAAKVVVGKRMSVTTSEAQIKSWMGELGL